MNCQDSCKDLEIQHSFLQKAIQKNVMQLGSTGLPKEGSMAPSPTSSESFIFSFSFLGRGVLVPTLQMCESAPPQAAPACLPDKRCCFWQDGFS